MWLNMNHSYYSKVDYFLKEHTPSLHLWLHKSTNCSMLVSMTVGDVRVIVSWMIEIMAHSCRHQNAHVSHSQFLLRTKQQQWYEYIIKVYRQASWENLLSLTVTEMSIPGGCTSGSFRTSSGWRRSSGGSYGTGYHGNFPGLPAVIDQHFFTLCAIIGQKVHV